MTTKPRTRTHATARTEKGEARPVSKPNDRHEREAERAGDVVARGGSVSSFSFSAVGASSAAVQRQGDDKPKSDDEKKKEALKKAGEAFLESKPGKDLKEKVLADPVVKTVKDAVTSPAGLAMAGVALGGGVAALGAAHKPLPVQAPPIPLDRITPGLSADVKLEGQVDRPSFVGLTLTYKEQGPKGKKKSDKPDYAGEAARLRATQEALKPEGQRLAEKQEEDALVKAWVLRQNLTIPLVPGAKPQVEEPAKDDEKKKDETPVQKAPASTDRAADAAPAEAYVDDALASPGRALDPSVRRAMESRFGYDFSGVRVHDDARAAATAAEIDAAAFTVGEDVVFGAGRFEPAGAEGGRLLAHELAHVVQQSRGAPGVTPVVQRRSIFESLGILLGLEEGTWEDRELHEYLDAVGQTGQIEGNYDSDNKARAIVRRWKSATPGFELLPAQKILLIREMLDGPTLGEDEECILDLLERSSGGDLRQILGPSGIALTDLESDINGDNRTRLDTFVSSRFDGGRQAVLGGRIEVVGDQVPAGAPQFAFDATMLEARFDGTYTVEELIALIEAMPEADRTQALHHLASVRRPRQLDRIEQLQRQFATETNPARQQAIQSLGRQARQNMLRTERVLLHFFREQVPATEADLRSGTSPSDPAREAEIREALHPPTHQTPQGAAQFRPILPNEAQSYEDKIRAELPNMVARYHSHIVGSHGEIEHADPTQTHTLVEFEAIGNVAKNETDAVFGQFYSAGAHPALVADRPDLGTTGNIHDQFTETQNQLAQMTPDQKQTMAKQLVMYFFQTDSFVRRLNRDHDASPQFDTNDAPTNPEATSLDTVANDFVASAANVATLNEIDRNWPATARPETREIFFQTFRGDTPDADRLLLWDVFQTFIHEYIHTLAADEYRTFADSFGGSSNEANTLIEGVDSLLTETVWDGIEPRVNDQSLRTQIEGPAGAAQPPVRVPHASARRYPSYTEALRLVDLVGIQALYAAYFLGLVDRIGGPPPAAAAPAAPGVTP